jgi:hypothetical protein
MRVLEPVWKPTGPFVHVPPAESVTPVIDFELPAASAMEATRASPAAVAGSGMLKAVPEVVSAPVLCATSAIEPPGGGGGGGEELSTVTVT